MDAFLEELRRAFARAPSRSLYYPGAQERLAGFLAANPDVIDVGNAADAMRIISYVDLEEGEEPSSLSTEIFGPALGVVFVEGSDPASFLSNAIAFANDRLHGTLGANVIIDPASEKALGVNFELLLAELRYGCIAGRLKGKIALSAVLMATVPTGAWAFSFNMPSDWQVSWDNTLTYNLGMRAGGIDPLIGTFRSWRAVVVAVVPLMITSILCEALMVVLGIGVKVATLPVTALGVGIGVDYALYFLGVQLAMQRRGYSLEEAHLSALNFTGKVIALIGVTLAAAVVTWAWSPIKFQADMGILLTFMFLWNMVGALVLIPALSHFLLRDVSTLPSTEKDSGSPGAKSRVASS